MIGVSGGLLTEIGGRIGDFAARKVGRGSGAAMGAISGEKRRTLIMFACVKYMGAGIGCDRWACKEIDRDIEIERG